MYYEMQEITFASVCRVMQFLKRVAGAISLGAGVRVAVSEKSR